MSFIGELIKDITPLVLPILLIASFAVNHKTKPSGEASKAETKKSSAPAASAQAKLAAPAQGTAKLSAPVESTAKPNTPAESPNQSEPVPVTPDI